MCLHTVDIITKQVKEGYKVFGCYAGKIYPEFRTEFILKQRRWLTAEGSTLTTDMGISYPCGFHVFTSLQDARAWAAIGSYIDQVIHRVVVDQILASGTQGIKREVVVAQRMYIMERVPLEEVDHAALEEDAS